MIFISYYPTYKELSNIINKYNPSTVNIFLDLKNCMSGIYMEDAYKMLLEANTNTKKPVSDIFQSWLSFISFHYNFMASNKINLCVYTFADVGESTYHLNLSKTYKANRLITKYKTMSEMEHDTVANIIKKNIEVIIKTANKLFNNAGIYLLHCESDFVPHYLINKNFQSDEYLNIIYSRDSDMLQTLKFHNTVLFDRQNKDNKRFYDYTNWNNKIHLDYFFDVINYPYYKAAVGDTSDNVSGIKRFGKAKAKLIFEGLTPCNDLSQFKEQIIEIPKSSELILNDWDNFETCYKLVSYDALLKKMPIPVLEQLSSIDLSNRLSFGESVMVIDKLIERIGL